MESYLSGLSSSIYRAITDADKKQILSLLDSLQQLNQLDPVIQLIQSRIPDYFERTQNCINLDDLDDETLVQIRNVATDLVNKLIQRKRMDLEVVDAEEYPLPVQKLPNPNTVTKQLSLNSLLSYGKVTMPTLSNTLPPTSSPIMPLSSPMMSATEAGEDLLPMLGPSTPELNTTETPLEIPQDTLAFLDGLPFSPDSMIALENFESSNNTISLSKSSEFINSITAPSAVEPAPVPMLEGNTADSKTGGEEENTSKKIKLKVIIYRVEKGTGAKPWKCDADGCDKSFTDSSNLLKHLRTHTKERPYTCSFEGCNKSFAHSSTLKEHLNSHNGQKPFVCTFPGCDKQFAQNSNLRRHLRIHTGDKPYVCDECTKGFTQSTNLRHHKDTVHKGKSEKTEPMDIQPHSL